MYYYFFCFIFLIAASATLKGHSTPEINIPQSRSQNCRVTGPLRVAVFQKMIPYESVESKVLIIRQTRHMVVDYLCRFQGQTMGHIISLVVSDDS